jgi:peptidoglycan/xylan/chitin deacetylase (PgdA/CDA1 family)
LIADSPRETGAVGSSSARAVYLTFDDGPDVEWTPQVLDVLASHDARATFFVVGCHVEREGALLRRTRGAGHEIGNHGYSHRHPWLVSEEDSRAEVRRGTDAIAQVLGLAPQLFRPAFGRRRAAMFDEARRSGQRVILWDVSAIDWGPFAKPERVLRRLERARAGDIVLLHDARNRRNHPEVTVKVLPVLLRSLAARDLLAAPLLLD